MAQLWMMRRMFNCMGLWEGCYVEVLVKPEAGKLQVHVKGLEDLIFLKFDKSNTVNILKEGIHERIRVSANKLLLLHQNKKLSNPVLTLGEYGFSDQSRIDVLMKPDKPLSPKRHSTMNIIVGQARTNKEVSSEVKSTDTVSGLKEKLQALGILADEHFLVHNQSPMSDKKRLEWHGVEEGHMLTIFQAVAEPEKLAGGGWRRLAWAGQCEGQDPGEDGGSGHSSARAAPEFRRTGTPSPTTTFRRSSPEEWLVLPRSGDSTSVIVKTIAWWVEWLETVQRVNAKIKPETGVAPRDRRQWQTPPRWSRPR
ncbi:hypothetical protein EJ110_NYTH41843 [Nymphaea thermarum]|nr:hypothetical protein EJ110_NYTH41843 [Nymphaea thermarum]